MYFSGYLIPERLVYLTGGGPETFKVISEAHIKNLKKFIGIKSNHSILEVGCGIGRDAIPLTKLLTSGKYYGIDIIKDSIDWCKENITPKNTNFRFIHFDVKDQLHNVSGVSATAEIILPIPDSSIDRVILFSVFTHMYEEDIVHYLKEFYRVLKPGGLIYGTVFLFDESILERARATNLTPFDLRFQYSLNEHTRINDEIHPLGAIAYSNVLLNKMVSSAKLEHARPMLRGAWSGYWENPDDGQDVLILRKPQ